MKFGKSLSGFKHLKIRVCKSNPSPHPALQMTRGDAEYQLKKMRVTLQKQPSMLYGEVKSETAGKKGAGNRVSSGNKRETSRGSLIRDMSRSSLNQVLSTHGTGTGGPASAVSNTLG